MLKFLERFLVTPKEVGIEKYSVEQIAEKMKPRDEVVDESLYEFARLVSLSLERHSRPARPKATS